MATQSAENDVNVLHNYSTAAQSSITAATRTYLTGSMVTLPSPGLQIGSRIRWTFDVTKTGAGTLAAASWIDIAFGINGTTGDTARLTFPKPVCSGVIDEGNVIVECLIRGPLTASGIVVGTHTLSHNLAATGLANVPCVTSVIVSSAFDVTFANCTRVGLCMTSASLEVITIQCMMVEIWNI